MKLVFILLLIPSVCLAAPKYHATPTPSPSPQIVLAKKDMVCRTKQQDLELRDWITGLMGEVHKAEADAKAANDANESTKKLLKTAVKNGKDLANECAADKQCAQAPLSCWVHRLMKHILWIGGSIVLLVIVLLVASVFVPALAPILSFLASIFKWILGLFTRKPPTA